MPKIVLLGDVKCGKTQLVKRLTGGDYSRDYRATIGADFANLIQKGSSLSVTLWDTSGDESFKSFGTAFYRKSSAVLYCVDLSVPLRTAKIINDIEEFKQICPDATVVFVGTKKDLCENSDIYEKQLADLKLSNQPFYPLSAAENTGISELSEHLFLLVTALHPVRQTSNYANARARFIESTDSLDLTDHAVVTNALEFLEQTIKQPDASPEVKADAIQKFTNTCNDVLKKKHPSVLQCALAFAAVAALTVVVGLIGFGIGFALGCWSGPGAFFAGVAAGEAAAMAVVSATTATPVLSSAALACGFYRQSPVLTHAQELAKEAPKGYIEDITVLQNN